MLLSAPYHFPSSLETLDAERNGGRAVLPPLRTPVSIRPRALLLPLFLRSPTPPRNISGRMRRRQSGSASSSGARAHSPATYPACDFTQLPSVR